MQGAAVRSSHRIDASTSGGSRFSTGGSGVIVESLEVGQESREENNERLQQSIHHAVGSAAPMRSAHSFAARSLFASNSILHHFPLGCSPVSTPLSYTRMYFLEVRDPAWPRYNPSLPFEMVSFPGLPRVRGECLAVDENTRVPKDMNGCSYRNEVCTSNRVGRPPACCKLVELESARLPESRINVESGRDPIATPAHFHPL